MLPVGNRRSLAQQPFPEGIRPENPRYSRSDLLWSQIAAQHLANFLEYLTHQEVCLLQLNSLDSCHNGHFSLTNLMSLSGNRFIVFLRFFRIDVLAFEIGQCRVKPFVTLRSAKLRPARGQAWNSRGSNYRAILRLRGDPCASGASSSFTRVSANQS